MALSKAACNSINKNYLKCITISSNYVTVKSKINDGTILPGDILGTTRHTCVYYGKDKNNNNLYSEGGAMLTPGINNVLIGHRNSTNDNDKIKVIARINTFNVKTSCENGTITASNKYIAGQNVKVTYSPSSGKKLKSIIIDGKELSKSQMRR